MAVAGSCVALLMVTVLTCRSSQHSPDTTPLIVIQQQANLPEPKPAASSETPPAQGMPPPAPSIALEEREAALTIPASVEAASPAQTSERPKNTPGGQAQLLHPPTLADIAAKPESVGRVIDRPEPTNVAVSNRSDLRSERYFGSLDDEKRKAASTPTGDAATSAKPGDVVVNTMGMSLVRIADGGISIATASQAARTQGKKAPITVNISKPFWIGQTEVTRKNWIDVMDVDLWQASKPDDRQLLPATEVSWSDALRFCSRLTELEREAGALPADEAYDLPTEAQWEFAWQSSIPSSFAAPNTTRDPTEFGWFKSNSQGLHIVGEKRVAGWSLFDMHGNAWEWCRDWYSERFIGGTDPTGPAVGSY